MSAALKKRPAASSSGADKRPAGTSQDDRQPLPKKMKILLSKAWNDLGEEEQARVLHDVELPPNVYRAFHSCMARESLMVPSSFKQRYEEAMSKKNSQGGSSSGKRSSLQELAKLRLATIRTETGDPDAVNVPSGFVMQFGFSGAASQAVGVAHAVDFHLDGAQDMGHRLRPPRG